MNAFLLASIFVLATHYDRREGKGFSRILSDSRGFSLLVATVLLLSSWFLQFFAMGIRRNSLSSDLSPGIFCGDAFSQISWGAEKRRVFFFLSSISVVMIPF